MWRSLNGTQGWHSGLLHALLKFRVFEEHDNRTAHSVNRGT